MAFNIPMHISNLYIVVVSHYVLRQWFTNTQLQFLLTACRRLEKLVLLSISDKSFNLDDVKLAELSNNSFEW